MQLYAFVNVGMDLVSCCIDLQWFWYVFCGASMVFVSCLYVLVLIVHVIVCFGIDLVSFCIHVKWSWYVFGDVNTVTLAVGLAATLRQNRG